MEASLFETWVQNTFPDSQKSDMQLTIKLDPSDFYEWTKNVFVKRTSNDMTYFQMVEHYGSKCREDGSFQYFQKSSDDIEELLDYLSNRRRNSIHSQNIRTIRKSLWLLPT